MAITVKWIGGFSTLSLITESATEKGSQYSQFVQQKTFILMSKNVFFELCRDV
jgi:hypothetical protein